MQYRVWMGMVHSEVVQSIKPGVGTVQSRDGNDYSVSEVFHSRLFMVRFMRE